MQIRVGKFSLRYVDVLMTVYAGLAARYVVSVDGALYLASAKSFFEDQMPFQYHWIREPLFPVFLRAVHVLFGNSDLVFTIAQSILFVAAVRLLLNRSIKRNELVKDLALVFIVGNSIAIGYVGAVLQQIWMLTGLCLIAWYAIGFVERRIIDRRLIFESILVGIVCGLVSVFLLLPLGITMAAMGIALLLEDLKFKNASGRTIGRYFVATSMPVIFALTFLGAWFGFKAIELQKNPDPSFNAWIWDYEATYLQEGQTKAMVIKPLLNIGFDLPSPWVSENDIYGMGLPNERCGGGVSQIPEFAYAYTGDYFESTCRPSWAYKLAHYSHGISDRFLTFALSLGFLCTLTFGFLFSRRAFLISLPGSTLIAFYWYSGAGISRYGFPVFATATISIVVAGVIGWKKLKDRETSLLK
jgi:hypothetical protein